MAQIARQKDAEISNGNIINADNLDTEFNSLVSESNSQDTRLTTIESGTFNKSGVMSFLNTPKTDTIAPLTTNGATALTLAGAGVNAQTGTTYTVVTGDRNKLITFSNASAVAVTLPQAGSTGFANNFEFEAKNIGAGTVTITPTTSTIDGAATLTLTTGQSVRLYSDGTNYFSAPGKATTPAVTALTSVTVSGAASLSITGWSSTCDFVKTLIEGTVANDGVDLNCRVKVAGTTQSGASDYAYYTLTYETPATNQSEGDAAHTAVQMNGTSTIGNAAGERFDFITELLQPNDTTHEKTICVRGKYRGTSGARTMVCGTSAAYMGSNSAIDGLEYSASAGNISATAYGWAFEG